MVGEVLAAHSDLGSPGPYIPTFYQLQEKLHVEHSCESSKVSVVIVPCNDIISRLHCFPPTECLDATAFSSFVLPGSI